MSDIAMSEAPAVSAPAPEPASPASEEAVETPNPIKTEPLKPEPKTIKESLANARAKLDASEKTAPARDAKAEAVKAKESAEPTPDKAAAEAKPDTKEKPVDATKDVLKSKDTNDAPARFSTEAKTKWTTVDETVRAETTRAVRELESGLTKYKEAAESYAKLKPYEDMAKAMNITLDKAMQNYTKLDQDLHSSNVETKIKAIERVLKAAGATPEQYANHVMAKKDAPQQQPLQSRELDTAMQRISQLEAKLNQRETDTKEQQQQEFVKYIEQWQSDKPDAEMLSEEIAANINEHGLSLDDAYRKARIDAEEKARRLGFIPATKQTVPPPPTAQTRLGQKSITGAPGPGSSPALRPSMSIRESIQRAIAQAG